MIHRPRVIPILTISNRNLVKTVKFKKPLYIGDPINAVKIFNGKGVDELCILDISATINNKAPDFDYLKEIASEAFIPLSYGGGIKNIEQIIKLFQIGFEKVIINSSFINDFELIKAAVQISGSQSIVAAIDVKSDFFGRQYCYYSSGKKVKKVTPIVLAKKYEEIGVGEIVLTSIDHEGQMQGYDFELMREVSKSINIPLIANGGAGSINDIKEILAQTDVSACAASSLFVFYGKQKAVLISYLEEDFNLKGGNNENFIYH